MAAGTCRPAPLFEFATAARIVFGAGTRREVAPAAAALGGCALLVTAGSAVEAAATALQAELHGAGVTVERFTVEGEPEIETVRAGVARARQAGVQMVLALGGGSVLDTGKAVAATWEEAL